MALLLARLLRLASIVICLIVAASFLTFAIQQTKAASRNQSEAIDTGSATGSSSSSTPHEGSVHKALDEASDSLTSPFAGIVSGIKGEWEVRTVKLLLALLVYGFGLGYVARVLRVRT